MGKLDNLRGQIVDSLAMEDKLSLRLLSWEAFDQAESPVLIVTMEKHTISATMKLFLDETKDNEFEVESLKIDSNALSINVKNYDQPIHIESKAIDYQFECLTETDLRQMLGRSRNFRNEQYQKILSLRNNVENIATFVDESISRVSIKPQSHPEGTQGYKVYKEQLKLLQKFRSRIETIQSKELENKTNA